MADNKKTKFKKPAIIGEFKTFISRGNVLDMAVGLIIGSAFTSIVNSLVSDIFMPLLGMITGKVDFAELKLVLQEEVLDGTEVVTSEVSINYGSFIQYIINFLLIAVAVFLLVKSINVLRSKAEKNKEKEEEKAPEPEPQIVLLTEIRDLLKAENAAEAKGEANEKEQDLSSIV